MPRPRKPKDRMIPRRPGAHAYAPPKDEEAAARWRASTFKPGQSGNPGGTPKPVKLIRDKIAELTRDGDEIIEFFVNTMRGSDDERVKVMCAEWLGERFFGKVKQAVDVSGPGMATPEQIALVMALQLSPHERRSRIAELKAKAANAEPVPSEAPQLTNGHGDANGD